MSYSHFILQGIDANDDHIASIENIFTLPHISRGLVASAFMNIAGAQMLIDFLGA